jgi:hypothetical protein
MCWFLVRWVRELACRFVNYCNHQQEKQGMGDKGTSEDRLRERLHMGFLRTSRLY